MLLGGVALGLIAGLLAGGRLSHLADIRLRWAALIFSAVILRYGTEIALGRGVPIVDDLRELLFAVSFAVLAAGLWANRRFPGMLLAFIGVAFNGLAIVLNGGYMPVWVPSLEFAGLTIADVNPTFHTLLVPPLDERFLLMAGPLIDVIPIPLPVIRDVVSVGDVFIAVGLAFFLFATIIRTPDEAEAEGSGPPLVGLAGAARLPRGLAPLVDRGQVRAETGLAPGLAQAAALERPLVLAGSGPGLSAPALAPLATGEDDIVAVGAGVVARPRPTPELLRRARRHPYVRLALNGPFSALWAGQLISVFGDRVHQIALAFLVYQATDSAIAVGLIFLTATLPNLLLGPIAGTLVDRWDQKVVMVVSDLLRAALILLIPVAAVINLALVYPLVFAVTSVSIFFRPARTAVLPRLVRQDDLLTANSAIWLGETFADVIGYPLAAGFVVALGASLPLAFWFDAVTYLASAMLIGSIAVPAVVRSEPVAAGIRGVADDLVAGWRFLRGETVLLANTLQGVAGQFTTGIMLAITVIYATEVIAGGDVDSGKVVYGLLETAIGLGNLIGGFAIGLIGVRLAKGRLVILGYTVAGACTMGLAFVGNLPLAFGLMLGGGIANMVYIIPSQTLFQERAPADMIGRVVGFRFALVFGALTLAMGVGGVAVEVIGITMVLILGGLLTFVAGVAGWFVPEVRDA